MTDAEIEWIEKFCDKYTPDTKGEPIVNRLDALGNKLKNIFLGIEMLKNKSEQEFPQFLN